MNTQTKTQTRPGYAATPSNAPRPNRPATMQPPPPAADDFERTFPPRPTQTPSAPPPRPPMAPPVTQRAPASAPTLADVMQTLKEIQDTINQLLNSRPQTAAPSLLSFVVTDYEAKTERTPTGEKKQYTKLFGGDFGKFGVRVWPEVLEAAGITDPAQAVGRTAYYTEAPSKVKEGMSRKITRIE